VCHHHACLTTNDDHNATVAEDEDQEYDGIEICLKIMEIGLSVLKM